MKKVSIIIPVYNASNSLRQCIESAVNQTLDEIEVITIDDGSTDNSLEILYELQEENKDKLKVFTKSNGGAGSARNLGIDKSEGEFIKFLDADDYLDKDVLERMYNYAKEYDVPLVRGNYRILIDSKEFEDMCSFSGLTSNQIVDVRENRDYIVTETPGIGNKLISRALIGDLRFPEKTKWEDLAIIPVIVASSKKLYHMAEPIYNYRIDMNTSRKDFIFKIPNILDIIKCVDIIEQEMKNRELYEEYKDQIEKLYILHTLFRVENAISWEDFSTENKKIVVSSLLGILDLKYPGWEQNSIIQQYRNLNEVFNNSMNILPSFVDEKYRNGLNQTILENQIEQTFTIK